MSERITTKVPKLSVQDGTGPEPTESPVPESNPFGDAFAGVSAEELVTPQQARQINGETGKVYEQYRPRLLDLEKKIQNILDGVPDAAIFRNFEDAEQREELDMLEVIIQSTKDRLAEMPNQGKVAEHKLRIEESIKALEEIRFSLITLSSLTNYAGGLPVPLAPQEPLSVDLAFNDGASAREGMPTIEAAIEQSTTARTLEDILAGIENNPEVINTLSASIMDSLRTLDDKKIKKELHTARRELFTMWQEVEAMKKTEQGVNALRSHAQKLFDALEKGTPEALELVSYENPLRKLMVLSTLPHLTAFFADTMQKLSHDKRFKGIPHVSNVLSGTAYASVMTLVGATSLASFLFSVPGIQNAFVAFTPLVPGFDMATKYPAQWTKALGYNPAEAGEDSAKFLATGVSLWASYKIAQLRPEIVRILSKGQLGKFATIAGALTASMGGALFGLTDLSIESGQASDYAEANASAYGPEYKMVTQIGEQLEFGKQETLKQFTAITDAEKANGGCGPKCTVTLLASGMPMVEVEQTFETFLVEWPEKMKRKGKNQAWIDKYTKKFSAQFTKVKDVFAEVSQRKEFASLGIKGHESVRKAYELAQDRFAYQSVISHFEQMKTSGEKAKAAKLMDHFYATADILGIFTDLGDISQSSMQRTEEQFHKEFMALGAQQKHFLESDIPLMKDYIKALDTELTRKLGKSKNKPSYVDLSPISNALTFKGVAINTDRISVAHGEMLKLNEKHIQSSIEILIDYFKNGESGEKWKRGVEIINKVAAESGISVFKGLKLETDEGKSTYTRTLGGMYALLDLAPALAVGFINIRRRKRFDRELEKRHEPINTYEQQLSTKITQQLRGLATVSNAALGEQGHASMHLLRRDMQESVIRKLLVEQAAKDLWYVDEDTEITGNFAIRGFKKVVKGIQKWHKDTGAMSSVSAASYLAAHTLGGVTSVSEKLFGFHAPVPEVKRLNQYMQWLKEIDEKLSKGTIAERAEYLGQLTASVQPAAPLAAEALGIMHKSPASSEAYREAQAVLAQADTHMRTRELQVAAEVLPTHLVTLRAMAQRIVQTTDTDDAQPIVMTGRRDIRLTREQIERNWVLGSIQRDINDVETALLQLKDSGITVVPVANDQNTSLEGGKRDLFGGDTAAADQAIHRYEKTIDGYTESAEGIDVENINTFINMVDAGLPNIFNRFTGAIDKKVSAVLNGYKFKVEYDDSSSTGGPTLYINTLAQLDKDGNMQEFGSELLSKEEYGDTVLTPLFDAPLRGITIPDIGVNFSNRKEAQEGVKRTLAAIAEWMRDNGVAMRELSVQAMHRDTVRTQAVLEQDLVDEYRSESGTLAPIVLSGDSAVEMGTLESRTAHYYKFARLRALERWVGDSKALKERVLFGHIATDAETEKLEQRWHQLRSLKEGLGLLYLDDGEHRDFTDIKEVCDYAIKNIPKGTAVAYDVVGHGGELVITDPQGNEERIVLDEHDSIQQLHIMVKELAVAEEGRT